MRRGDVVIIAQRGTYEGKPRPAVVIQAEAFLEEHPSVLVCHVTATGDSSSSGFYRVPVAPTDANGLRSLSTIMADRYRRFAEPTLGRSSVIWTRRRWRVSTLRSRFSRGSHSAAESRRGVSWQITPRVLTEALAAGGAEAKRAFDAMMEMKKIDVAKIEKARRG